MRKLLYIFTLLLVVGVTSCSIPLSKESYLEKLDLFVSEVSENYKTYSDKDWEKKTEKFEKFSGEWYEKFKDDFTWKEKIKVAANIAKFSYYKTLSQLSSTAKDLFDTFNVKEAKEKVKNYIQNDMGNGLNHFYEEALKAGSAAGETLTEILEDLQNNLEQLLDTDDE